MALIRNKKLAWFLENIILALLIFLFWNTSVVKFFKILVVFLHESCHAAAAILTGGHVKNIVVTSMESGVTFVSGGIPVFVYSAGYLGTAAIGSLLIAAGHTKRLKKIFFLVIAVSLLLSTLFFVRNRFGMLYGLITGAVFLFLVIKDFKFTNYISDFTGMMCVMYSIYDFLDFIKSDTNDATILSRITGVPSVLIYSSWVIISLFMFYFAFSFSYRQIKKKFEAQRPASIPPST